MERVLENIMRKQKTVRIKDYSSGDITNKTKETVIIKKKIGS